MPYKLEEVVNEFESWRQERVSRNEQIPEHLWAIAKTILPHYKASEIQRSLRISGQQFNKYLGREKSKEAAQIDCFASYVIGSATNQDKQSTCEIILQGLRKSLKLKVDIKELPGILPLLEGYL